MIYSKANLEVVRIASKDEFDRGLCGVRLEPDGSTVAGNGRMFLAVGPVTYEDKLKWPESAGERIRVGVSGMILTREAVEEALKGLGRGKGLRLMHVALTKVKDVLRVGLTSINGRGDTLTGSSRPKDEVYPPWRKIVRKLGRKKAVQVCVSRKDLGLLISAMEAACPDGSGLSPVFIEVSEDGRGLVLRGVNKETGQHALGVMTTIDTKGKWMIRDEWEKRVFGKLL